MSKKKKFMKKKFKAEIISALKKTNLPDQPQAVVEVAKPDIAKGQEHTETPSESQTEFQTETIQAKKDLKKTALIIGILVIILLVIYFTNIKTGWLDNFANTLAKVLNIQ